MSGNNMDIVVPFTPFCFITIAGVLLLNRYGWRLSRVLFCLALIFALNFAELEIAWHYIGYRAPLVDSLFLALLLSVLLLSPLILLMSVVGYVSYIKGHNPIWGICTCLALYISGYIWLVLWIRSPATPDLTTEQATRILQSRPEFQSQGYSPSFSQIERPHASSMKDYLCYGHFSFISTTGERINDGLVTFQFQNGHWAFAGYRWGPPDRSLTMTVGSREPMPTPLTRKNIESPYAPGVAWKRLSDGSYVKYDPNARKANSK